MTAGETKSFDEITYAVVGGRPLRLALRLPAVASPARPCPCVLWLHSGGWESGSRLPIPKMALRLVDEREIAVASVDYRLTSEAGEYGDESVLFPAQLHDVKAAVRWLRANAEMFGVDATRFGAWGASAGGHLAALLAFTAGDPEFEGNVGDHLDESSAVQAFVDYYGPTSLLEMDLLATTPPGSAIEHDAPDSPESRVVGWSKPGQGVGDIRAHRFEGAAPYATLLARIAAADPITHVTSSAPPGFIAHGDRDRAVPLACSQRLADALERAGVACGYRIVPGAGHGPLGASTDSAAIEFLAERLASGR